MNPVHVLITMDVEPVKLEGNWTGPVDADESERTIRAYRELARQRGFPVSLFIHPEAAELHSAMFREFQNDGDCLGLHIHATKFHYPEYQYEFGYYTGQHQREILERARDEWADSIGRPPELFRPGAFSANDASFKTLVDLGFRGGSLTIPGRVWPQRYCVWAGAELYPHRAHPAFRLVPGDMPFANVPLSVDVSAPVQADGYTYYRDLRPTARNVSTRQTLENIVARIARDQPHMPVIHMVAHNDQPFDDPASESRRRYETVLDRVHEVCSRHDLQAEGSTIDAVCNEVLAHPGPGAPQWLEDNDVV